MPWLCLSVTFLGPSFRGLRRWNPPEPEWPPSPLRLFQAMVAGVHEAWRGRGVPPEIQGSLRWLEEMPAPTIVAPQAEVSARAHILYVPANNSDTEPIREDRLTPKPEKAVLFGDGAAVHYIWPIPDADPDAERRALAVCEAARHIRALGRGIDLAVGHGKVITEPEKLPAGGVRWVPLGTPGALLRRVFTPDADDAQALRWHGGPLSSLRVPCRGTLADLEASHAVWRNQLAGDFRSGRRDPTVCAEVEYSAGEPLPARPCAVFQLPPGMAILHQHAALAAAMTRSAACHPDNRSDFEAEFGDNPEVYLAGHVNVRGYTPPRFSYLPLPSIGDRHADGMIRRIAIAEPRGGSGERARWASRRLFGWELREPDGTPRGRLDALQKSADDDHVLRLYLGSGTVWASVTPVILPGYDDRDMERAMMLFSRALAHEGIPRSEVARFRLRKAPFWSGSQHPLAYRRPDYLRGRSAWHACVAFHRPVSGPLSIGSGRHCGLGIFAVWGR
jgi:CRISPR-associated protein Csb2